MTGAKKQYTAFNLPKDFIDRLKVLKKAYDETYCTNYTYEDMLEGMIANVEKCEPKVFALYKEKLAENFDYEEGEELALNSRLEFLKTVMSSCSDDTGRKKKLHEVIAEVITAAGRPLTVAEITRGVNSLGTYHRADGGTVPQNQISARIKNYPNLFDVDIYASPKLVSLKNK